MKKSLIALVMTFAMIFAMTPAIAFAGSVTDCGGGTTCTHTASVTDAGTTTHYDTLKEAVDAVPDGGTVTLLNSMESGTTDGFDCTRYPDKTFSIDKNGKTLRGDIGYIYEATNITLNIKYYICPNWQGSDWESYKTHLRTQNENMYTYSPVPDSLIIVAGRYNNNSFAPTEVPTGKSVYLYASLNDALESSSSNAAIILFKDINGNVEIDSVKGPTTNKTVNVILNGHALNGEISKPNYLIEKNNPAEGIISYKFKNITATITDNEGTVHNYFGGPKAVLAEAISDAASKFAGKDCTFRFTATGPTLTDTELTIGENVKWEIPDGQTVTVIGKGTLTIDGNMDLKGTLKSSSINCKIKVKGTPTFDTAKITASTGNKIVSYTDGDYTVFQTVYGGDTPEASYLLPGSDTWIPVKYISEAVTATNEKEGGAIRLEEDASNGISVANCTLDLNGYTMWAQGKAFTFGENTVIKDSSAAKTGAIKGTGSCSAVTPDKEGGSLTIESGTIYNPVDFAMVLSTKDEAKVSVTIGKDAIVWAKEYAILIQPNENNYADINLDISGTVYGEKYGGVYINGQIENVSNDITKVTIRDGANISCKSTTGGAGIYAAGYGEWNISGGTISGYTGMYQKSGSIVVKGGTVIGNGAESDYIPAGGGFTPTGDAIVIDNCGYSGQAPAISLLNGHFISENAKAVASYAKDDTLQPVDNFIKGGYFSNNPDEAYLHDSVDIIIKLSGSDKPFVIGEAAKTEIANAKPGDTIEIMKISDKINVADGVIIKNSTGSEIIVNDNKIPNGESFSVETPLNKAEKAGTGDNSNLMIPLILMLIAASGIGVAAFRRNRG